LIEPYALAALIPKLRKSDPRNLRLTTVASRPTPFRRCVDRGKPRWLAKADAFGSLKLNARASLWRALVPTEPKGTRPLFEDLAAEDESAAELPTMDGQEEVFADYRSVGLSLKAHPISFFRSQLEQLDVVPVGALKSTKDGRFVRVGGLVLVRQRP